MASVSFADKTLSTISPCKSLKVLYPQYFLRISEGVNNISGLFAVWPLAGAGFSAGGRRSGFGLGLRRRALWPCPTGPGKSDRGPRPGDLRRVGPAVQSHRAGGAVASSVTMCPRESLRFVTEAHRHLSPVREAGCASQPQRRRTAIAESRQMKACASQ